MTCISLSILNQEQEVRKAKIDDSDSLKELTITGKDFVTAENKFHALTCLFSCSGLSITRRRCDSSLFRYAQYLFNGEVRCYA